VWCGYNGGVWGLWSFSWGGGTGSHGSMVGRVFSEGVQWPCRGYVPGRGAVLSNSLGGMSSGMDVWWPGVFPLGGLPRPLCACCCVHAVKLALFLGFALLQEP